MNKKSFGINGPHILAYAEVAVFAVLQRLIFQLSWLPEVQFLCFSQEKNSKIFFYTFPAICL